MISEPSVSVIMKKFITGAKSMLVAENVTNVCQVSMAFHIVTNAHAK